MSKEQNKKRAGMASKAKIKEYWGTKLVELEKFDSISELMEADYCFACGFYYPKDETFRKPNTVRAHITPLCHDGGNGPDNLHCLCEYCHDDSEYLYGEDYWAWFKRRNIIDVVISRCIQRNGWKAYFQPAA